MAGGAAATFHSGGGLGPGENGGDKVGAFDPGIGGVEDFGVGAEAVEDFAEEPFGGVSSAAFGQVLGVVLLGEGCNFGGFGVAGVVFPEPSVGVWVVGEFGERAQGCAIFCDGQGGGTCGIDADADDFVGFEGIGGLGGFGHSLSDGDFYSFEVVGGVLPSEVVVGGVEDYTGIAGLVFIDGGGHLFAGLHVNDEASHGVCAVV